MTARLTRVVAVPTQAPACAGRTLTLLVPLTPDGRLDEGEVPRLADSVTATLAGGTSAGWTAPIRVGEDGWTLQPTSVEDAPPWRLAAGVLRPGGYLSLRAPGADPISYRIVNVAPLDRAIRDDEHRP
ncbi:MAG: hypothetical protein J0H67_02820 [Rhodospirillales bacterium]|nr:hypothetical protein [Rhodospirillales bacterium]